MTDNPEDVIGGPIPIDEGDSLVGSAAGLGITPPPEYEPPVMAFDKAQPPESGSDATPD